jgi:asparagine synthase (glutamine-hydrolysing)
MCRIAGILEGSDKYDYDIEVVIRAMNETLQHGGPDDNGIFTDSQKLAFGHNRLSILDLSSNGHQPMRWKNWVIVFNGEIYNFKEIAQELVVEGYNFETTSDTEVIIKAIDFFGLEAVEKFRGMFAFALWNTHTQELILCRDRVGVKPLYWFNKNDTFLFASELKAFTRHPNFDKEIDQAAVSLFLQYGYIKAPYTIYKYAHKLLPGSFLKIDKLGEISVWKYWDVKKIYAKSLTEKHEKSEEDTLEECEKILSESFRLRMVSDVPVGVFLSGGVDSSLVCTLLQNKASAPIHTFTIGFDSKEYDESIHAKKIAEHLKTNHTQLHCDESHFNELISKMPEFFDEPFGDSSWIPTYLVCKLARQEVKVVLSGDGGDELFAGYPKYKATVDFYERLKKVPKIVKRGFSYMLGHTDSFLLRPISSLLNYKKDPYFYWRTYKLSSTLSAESYPQFLDYASRFIMPSDLKKLHKFSDKAELNGRDSESKKDKTFSLLGMLDIESYLEGDILTKVDRTSMQVALEGREPLLDHKIIEYALTLSDNYKVREGKSKWILKEILYKYVPKELIERPKRGFGIPIEKWTKQNLKNEINGMLNDEGFFSTFLLDKKYVTEMIKKYFNRSSSNINPHFVWFLYTLYCWYKRWIVA